MIDFENKRFMIFGLNLSGKTVLAKYILSHHDNHIVYDPMHEYDGFNRYKTTYANQDEETAQKEITLFINKVVKNFKPSMLVIDEINRFCPSMKTLPLGVADLNNWYRHISKGLSFGGIARRPTQVNTDLVELAHYLFIFSLKGKNSIQYLNEVVVGLGDAVADLEPYHFVFVDEHRKYKVMNPVPLKVSYKWNGQQEHI